MGIILDGFSKYGDPIAAYKEVIDICAAMSATDLLQYRCTNGRHTYSLCAHTW